MVEQAHHHDLTRPARLVGEVVVQDAVGPDRVWQADRRKRAERLDVDRHAVGAVEQSVDFRAYGLLERRLIHALLLRLAGHDQPRGITRRGFQRLAREKHDRGFDDGEDEREERSRDQRKLDGDRAILLADKTPGRAAAESAAKARRKCGLDGVEHGRNTWCLSVLAPLLGYP